MQPEENVKNTGFLAISRKMLTPNFFRHADLVYSNRHYGTMGLFVVFAVLLSKLNERSFGSRQ
jgi:hypothetical protein